jgi:Ca-activated chloride channel family protein
VVCHCYVLIVVGRSFYTGKKKSYRLNSARTILFYFFILVLPPSYAQQAEEIIKTGNDLYRKGEYEKASGEFQKVSTDQRAKFNYGNALYKQNKKDEAAAVYDGLSTIENKPELRSQSFYNKGVILSGRQKLEESIEAYKNTLRLDPDDIQARENLQKALLELKKKQPPKKVEKKTPQQKPPPQPKMNRKQAEQKLKQLQQKEKETQQRMQKKSPSGEMQIKDW